MTKVRQKEEPIFIMFVADVLQVPYLLRTGAQLKDCRRDL